MCRERSDFHPFWSWANGRVSGKIIFEPQNKKGHFLKIAAKFNWRHNLTNQPSKPEPDARAELKIMFSLRRATQKRNRDSEAFAPVFAIANDRVAEIDPRYDPARRVKLDHAAEIHREIRLLAGGKQSVWK